MCQKEKPDLFQVGFSVQGIARVRVMHPDASFLVECTSSTEFKPYWLDYEL
jgi:hypothetical protein